MSVTDTFLKIYKVADVASISIDFSVANRPSKMLFTLL